jgi:hypothetical protein
LRKFRRENRPMGYRFPLGGKHLAGFVRVLSAVPDVEVVRRTISWDTRLGFTRRRAVAPIHVPKRSHAQWSRQLFHDRSGLSFMIAAVWSA